MIKRAIYSALAALFAISLSGAKAGAAAKSASPALVRDSIPFSQLGYEADPVLVGTDATFTFHVPTTTRLRAVYLRLSFITAKQLSPASTISVDVGKRELERRTIAALRAQPTIAIAIPLAHPGRSIAVRLAAHLHAAGNPCRDMLAKNLWVALRSSSRIDIQTAVGRNRPYIGEFLDPYGGSIEVDVPKTLSERSYAEATALTYELKRINRWRNRRVVIADRPSAASYRIVLEPTDTKWSSVGREMHLSVASLPALLAQIEQLLVAAGGLRTANTLNEWPIGVQTVHGAGPLPIFASVAIDALDSYPADASLQLDLAHSAVPARGLAFVDVYVDGRRAARRTLRPVASKETFAIPLDSASLNARTRLAIVPTYYPHRTADCNGALAAMTFRIGPGSRLRWEPQSPRTPTVSDFLTSVRGRLALLTPDDLSPAIAPQILDILGSVNNSVTSVDVRSVREGPRPDDDALMLFGPPKDNAAGATFSSSLQPVVSAGRYAGRPTLFVSGAGEAGVDFIASTASFVTRGASLSEDSGSGLIPARLTSVIVDETYSEHLRRAAVPSLTVFACALTFMLFASRRREPT